MQFKSLTFYNNHLANEQMNFLYTGDFSDKLTDWLIELNNHQFATGDEFKSLQRRAAFLIAECFQNIVRHSDLSNQDDFFHIKNNFGLFSLISGNTIEKGLVAQLQGQLEQLNKLTTEELREKYREKLSKGKLSEKGGAGLGLIEMARKTKNKLSFRFSELSDIKSYFYFQLVLRTIVTAQRPESSTFDEDIMLRSKMLQDGLFLVYHGKISTDIASALLRILENSFFIPSQKIVFIKLMRLIDDCGNSKVLEESVSNMTLTASNNKTNYHIGVAFTTTILQATKISRSFSLYESLGQESLLNEHIKSLNDKNENKLYEHNLDFIKFFINSSSVALDVISVNNNLSKVSIILGFQKKSIADKAAIKSETLKQRLTLAT